LHHLLLLQHRDLLLLLRLLLLGRRCWHDAVVHGCQGLLLLGAHAGTCCSRGTPRPLHTTPCCTAMC
jgi:hypothetical protein